MQLQIAVFTSLYSCVWYDWCHFQVSSVCRDSFDNESSRAGVSTSKSSPSIPLVLMHDSLQLNGNCMMCYEADVSISGSFVCNGCHEMSAARKEAIQEILQTEKNFYHNLLTLRDVRYRYPMICASFMISLVAGILHAFEVFRFAVTRSAQVSIQQSQWTCVRQRTVWTTSVWFCLACCQKGRWG